MKGTVVKGLSVVVLLSLLGAATVALAQDGGEEPVDILTTELLGEDLVQALELPRIEVQPGERFRLQDYCKGSAVELGEDLYCIPRTIAPTDYEQWKVGQQVRGHLPSGTGIENPLGAAHKEEE